MFKKNQKIYLNIAPFRFVYLFYTYWVERMVENLHKIIFDTRDQVYLLMYVYKQHKCQSITQTGRCLTRKKAVALVQSLTRRIFFLQIYIVGMKKYT